MRQTARVVARVVMIAVAVRVFIGLTVLYAGSVRPPQRNPRFEMRERRRRPNAPQLLQVGDLAMQTGLWVAIGFAGRKLLRLRLSD